MTDNNLHLGPLTPSSGRRMEQVVAAIRSAVDAKIMKPGVKYSVYQLADQLGVSRTPVRDALLRLEDAGLIRFEARQGFYILLPHPSDIADIFAIRLALEVPAVRRAAVVCNEKAAEVLTGHMQLMNDAIQRSDEKTFAAQDSLLHDYILGMAGNGRAQKIVAALRESTRLLGASTADRTRTLTDIENEHKPIVDAIMRNDPRSAESAMRIHLASTGRLLVTQAALEQSLEDLDITEICGRIDFSTS